MEESTAIVTTEPRAALSVFDMTPKNKVEHFTEMANILGDIISKQKMYTNIQGKKYVKVDGWITLGNLIGILPREKTVTETEDKSYIAEVELINFNTGKIVGGASSLCSVTELRWKDADKYARRSMAVTRATGKAYRLAFSWVMNMAGYEVTPSEEMPIDIPFAPTPIKVKPQPPADEIYTGTQEQEAALANYLETSGVSHVYFEAIGERMKGKHKSAIRDVMAQVIQ